MRSVFSWSRGTAAAWLLLVVLLAPNAFGSDATTDASLWAEFVAWVDGQVDMPGGVPDFTTWIMSRLHIPGG